MEPFGSTREDQRLGTIAALLANQWSDGSRRPLTPSDFFPNVDTPSRRQQSLEEMKLLLKGFARVNQ